MVVDQDYGDGHLVLEHSSFELLSEVQQTALPGNG